jgi:hypothetical protein
MFWCYPNGARLSSDLQYIDVAAGEIGMSYSPPSAPGDNLIANLNLLYRNTSTMRNYGLIFGYTNFVEPCATGVIATPHVGIVRSLCIDLCPIREKNHGSWTLLEPMLYSATLKYS